MGAAISAQSIEAMKSSLRGTLITPSEAGFDSARAVWNGMINKRPALIARCLGSADVIQAVAFARDNGLPLAVRAGGHNVAGSAVIDNGLVIDLSSARGVRVDPKGRTARAAPGSTWADYDHETQAFGLASTGGLVSTTGVAGLTLGGGTGWLVRKYGIAADNLRSVDIVTADGQLRTVSEKENTDLFWAIRGAGANFGVVTSLEFDVHEVGPVIHGGMVVHPFTKAREVYKFYREFTAGAPDEVMTAAVVLSAPDGTVLLALLVCHCGTAAQAERDLAPLKKFGPPIDDKVGPMKYTEIQKMVDGAFPPGLQNYWKSNFLKALPDDAIEIILDHGARISSPNSVIILEHMGGAMNRKGADATAFPHRDALYDFITVSMWPNAAEKQKHVDWTRTFWEAVQPYSTGGVYVNMLGAEGESRIKSAYGANYDKLAKLKAKYDPQNLFQRNHNITPG